MDWIKANLWEIRQSSSLRYLGAMLALSHVLTFILWYPSDSPLFNSHAGKALCWDFIPNCVQWQFLSPAQMQGFFITYAIFAGVSMFCFFSDRLVGLGWTLLLISFFSKLFVYLIDVELIANAHALLFAINFFYLFIPQKRVMAITLILCSYFVSAWLKFNPDWLAGFWLREYFTFLPDKGVEWTAALMALAEVVLPLTLLSRKPANFYKGVGLLLAYHISYWAFIGFFEPLIYTSFLVFIVASFVETQRKEHESMYQSYIRPEPSKFWAPIGLLLFASVQLMPLWVPHPLLESNPIRYKKYAVPVECHQYDFIVFENGIRETISYQKNGSDVNCNPQLRLQKTKQLCDEHKSEPQFRSVASFFISRTVSQQDYLRVFEALDICNHELDPLKGDL